MSSAVASRFVWGTASASYQVEGGWQADGKGLSNWDVYTNRDRITVPATGKQETGNVACNTYDRDQYLRDIALMRELGANAYRFSLSWARILPEGTGRVNQPGLAYYSRLVDDLIAAGIEPMVTLFHWDLPQALQEKGAWGNRESVQWFRAYAATVVRALGDRVDKFITLNEPFIDLFLMEPAAENIRAGRSPNATSAQYGKQATAMHHWLLANALVTEDFHKSGHRGMIGCALPLVPMEPLNPDSGADRAAATLADGIVNRWWLDAAFKGTYPADVIAALQKHNPAFVVPDEDMSVIRANPSDFLGVNFYSQAYAHFDEAAPLGCGWMDTNPDKVKAFNGPVRPDELYKLLLRIKTDYGNPPVFITENGAGFGDFDEIMEGSMVKDPLRTDYIRRHIAAALKARADGADLRGYFCWSLLDNFEWMQGYERRFGIVHVDFATQKRTPKQSYLAYREIIAENASG
jgi:beta-glucosidase